MELENSRTIHEEVFMVMHDGAYPEELGYKHFKMYRKWYIYGKSKEAIDAFISYKKATREARITTLTIFPPTIIMAIVGIFIGSPLIILLALVLLLVFNIMVAFICRNNSEYRQKFFRNIKIINKSDWKK